MENLAKVPGKINRWIRLYRDSLHNPKIVSLSDRQHRAWHNCLLIADDAGNLPPLRDIACHLRMSVQDAEQLLCDLVEAGLIDVRLNGSQSRSFAMHDWTQHQYVSDNVTERVKKFRNKNKAKNDETFHVTERNVTVTPPDTESDTDTEVVSTPSSAPPVVEIASEPTPKPKAKPPRGARLDANWALTDDLQNWTRINFAAATPESIDLEVARFRDYWHAKAGQGACKLDWAATWRNWCRTAFASRPATIRHRPDYERKRLEDPFAITVPANTIRYAKPAPGSEWEPANA